MRPLLGLLLLLLVSSCFHAVPEAGAEGEGRFFVPTGKRTGFGHFREGRNPAARLRQAFGPPESERLADDGFVCVFGWPSIGVTAELVAFGSADYPCGSEGTFVEARLTDPRWHTASGVHPGGPKRAAHKAALRRCTQRTCGVFGYALELHHTVCSTTLSAGVIAHVRGHRVVSLVVRWRGCE